MEIVPWLTLILLGAFHGLNPGMGWLFAVALGLQDHSRSAVIRALGPIAFGHALSIAVVVAVVGAAGLVVSTRTLQWICATGLIAFGLYKLLAPMSHPRWVGMRVRGRELATWSFLMATAHGAGLMLVPVLTRDGDDEAHAMSAMHTGHDHGEMVVTNASTIIPADEVLTVLVHTAAMFVVMGAIAVVVFDRVGLAMLRRGWFNMDRVWTVMLLVTGVFTFSIAL